MLIRIMALKEREDNIKKMLSSLPSWAEPIWDTDHNACHTLCRVLNSDEPMLVMEDDIELCENFYRRAKKEIDKHPQSFVMFYSCKAGEDAEAKNKEQGKPYNRPYVYTQAFYVPAGLGKRLSEFLKTNKNAINHRYSKGINEYLVQEGIDRYLVQPSLVQHIGFESILDAGMGFPMHQSKTYKYEDDFTPKKTPMKFDYKPGKETYSDYLKRLMGVKKKKASKKKKEEEDVEILSLDELNK